jgi:hypothetical protein
MEMAGVSPKCLHAKQAPTDHLYYLLQVEDDGTFTNWDLTLAPKLSFADNTYVFCEALSSTALSTL